MNGFEKRTGHLEQFHLTYYMRDDFYVLNKQLNPVEKLKTSISAQL